MSQFPWCTSKTDTAEQRKEAAEELYNELEKVHADISDAEWAEIIKPMNLGNYEKLKPFIERPRSVRGNWFNLVEPVEPWAPVKAIVFSPTEDSLERSIDTDIDLIKNVNFTALPEESQEKLRGEGKFGPQVVKAVDIVYEARQLVIDYAAAKESGDLFMSAALISDTIPNNLSELQTYIDSQRGNGLDRAALEALDFIESDFVANVNSLIQNEQASSDLDTSAQDFCPTKEDIKDYYTQALLIMALPEIAKEERNADLAALALELVSGIGPEDADAARYRALANRYRELASNIEDIINAKVSAAAVEAFATEAVFREQCFILTNLPKFVEARKKQDELVGLPYSLKNYQTPELKERLENSAQLKSYVDSNKPINIQGDPFPFINKLTVNPNQAALFDLREEQLSSLTPRIRLFKSEYNKETKREEEIEIKFDAHAGNEVLGYLERKGKGGRGLGVGVKRFTFSYDGTDPFSAKKAISAKLDLYAPSFSDLLRERTGITKSGTSRKYKYVDLALKTGGNVTENKKKTLTQVDKENLDKLNFRIRVMIEFAASKDVLRTFRKEQESYSNVLKNAVYDSAMSIYLTPTIHEFNFDEAGGVSFSINYLAYIEDYFSQPNFDIFTGVQQIKKARSRVLSYFKEQNCEDKSGYDNFKEEDLKFIERINETSLNTIVREMFLSQKIYFLNFNDTMIKNFFQQPFSFDVSLKKQSMAELEKDATDVMKAVLKESDGSITIEEDEGTAIKTRKILASLVAYSENKTKVSFIYLNDIISIVMKLIDDNLRLNSEPDNFFSMSEIDNYINNVASSLAKPAKLKQVLQDDFDAYADFFEAARAFNAYKRMRVVLGPANIGLPQNKSVICALGDIPISVNYFIDFMSDKLLSKNLSSYPLSKFIKDLINDCIKNFINDDTCNRVDLGEKMQLNSTTVLSYDTRDNFYTEDNLSDLIASQMRIEKDGLKIATREVMEMDKVNLKMFPLLKVSGPRDDPRTFLEHDKMRNYYIFSASRKYPSNSYLGIRSQDAKNGIFHYILGEDKGMLKTISLDKTNTPGLKELRFEQEGFAGLEQLREVYNANITTFLNVQTFPGTYIYIEPNGFDPTATDELTRFGIGGYYMITKTSHTIEPGNAETEINAAWVASKGTYIRSKKDGSEEERTGPEVQKKCSTFGGFRS